MRVIATVIVFVLSGCHVYQDVGDDPDATVSSPDANLSADARPPIASECGDCPVPDPGRITVCGWLRDVETDEMIGTIDTNWADCSSLTPRPTTGPCALDVHFYEALMFAGNPTGTPPLQPSRLSMNTCGRFIGENLPAPALGYLAIAVDDHAAVADFHRLSGLVMDSRANLLRDDVQLYVVRRSTDMKWTNSAGNPFSATFGDRGAAVSIFRHQGVPAAGVVMTENGAPQPSDDFYFDDTDPTERTSIDTSQTATGPNGTALMVDSALVNQSGEGGLPAGCTWPSQLGDAIPGVYLVHRRDSDCP